MVWLAGPELQVGSRTVLEHLILMKNQALQAVMWLSRSVSENNSGLGAVTKPR